MIFLKWSRSRTFAAQWMSTVLFIYTLEEWDRGQEFLFRLGQIISLHVDQLSDDIFMFATLLFWWRRFLSTSAWLLFWIVTRSAMRGVSMNMSWLKTIEWGEFCSIALTKQWVSCIAIARALWMSWFASWAFIGGLVWTMVRSVLQIVWCILSQIAFDCRFSTVIGTSLIPYCDKSSWNFQPMNSPPLSWTHKFGLGYRDSQQFSKCCRM